jgi:hypothetical protein
MAHNNRNTLAAFDDLLASLEDMVDEDLRGIYSPLFLFFIILHLRSYFAKLFMPA